jgi:hypothetical protein
MRIFLLLLAIAVAPRLGAQALPLEPIHARGQGITGAFEGWFQNPDGTYSILLGYYSRNASQEIDIPAGPNNRIEPGGPDQGQPTHFLPGRQWGMFTVIVPKDFGKNKITWTITANGQTSTIPASLDPLWEISPMEDAIGNTPPVIKFEDGVSVQGPKPVTAKLSVAVATPLPLVVTVSDDAKLTPGMTRPRTPPAVVSWSKFRGPGEVTFANTRPPVEGGDEKASPFSGKASTTATFSEPGEYVLRLQGNDWTGPGGRGFSCCWTNALVQVSVRPAQ